MCAKHREEGLFFEREPQELHDCFSVVLVARNDADIAKAYLISLACLIAIGAKIIESVRAENSDVVSVGTIVKEHVF